MFEKRKAEISRRKAEIRRMLESGKDDQGNAINIDEITTELRNLNDELADLERREQTLGEIEGRGGGIPNPLADDNYDKTGDEAGADTRAILTTPEYRNAFAKTLLGRTLTDKEHTDCIRIYNLIAPRHCAIFAKNSPQEHIILRYSRATIQQDRKSVV